ncbi:MAG: hypothetical protein ABWZ66_09190, partial [Pyrinomonadaceae bacterium]
AEAKLPDDKIVRIKPSEYTPSPNCPKMPANIVKYLEDMNCLLPQPSYKKDSRAGAFQIQFANPGQNDWAVLCSRGGVSSILVFWHSLTTNVSEFAKYPDKDFVDAAGFFRAIGKTARKPSNKYNINTYGDIFPELNLWGIDEQKPNRKQIIYYIYKNQLVVLENED